MEPSLVYLRRPDTRETVPAELWDGITDHHLELWQTTWMPLIDRFKARLQAAKLPRDQWPQDLHWEWDKKLDVTRHLLAMRHFAITCGGALQGMMMLNLTKYGRLKEQFGKDLAYVEYLNTAPWNRPEISGTQQFSGVGTTMIATAIEASREEGFKGRVGLHSLAQSAKFYRDHCGMSELGRDPDYYGLTYFEMTTSQADQFAPSTSN